MRRTTAQVLGVVGSLTLGAIYAAGAAPMAQAAPRPTAAADSSVTGCLQKGSTADQFTLAGKDGKSYTVSSKAVKLAGHVGHTVTLAGTPAASDPMTMTVSKLTMVSPSCS
jgi:hypothetical protein